MSTPRPLRLVASALLAAALWCSSCASPPPPPTRRSVEAPRYPSLQGRQLKVEVVDHGNFLGGDPERMASLVERLEQRLASGGVIISAEARQTLRLELSSSQQPARGEEWCVRVGGSIDTGQPAYLPQRQYESVRCAAITRVERNPSAALGEALLMGFKAATGAASEELARRHAIALADSLEDVLNQVGAAQGF